MGDGTYHCPKICNQLSIRLTQIITARLVVDTDRVQIIDVNRILSFMTPIVALCYKKLDNPILPSFYMPIERIPSYFLF